MKVSVFFHTYITSNGPQQQKCQSCGAVHLIAWDNVRRTQNVTLAEPGVRTAKPSDIFPYPEYKPYRVGPYRIQFSNHNWGVDLWNWDGDKFHNGPMLMREGSIIAWQGLAGDMEHTKRMPYELNDPLSNMPAICDEGDE